MTVEDDIRKAWSEKQPYYDELAKASDRAAAIVMHAYLDEILLAALKKRLVPLSNTFKEDFFAGHGPMATFAARVELGLAIGLYGAVTKVELSKINSIRNRFAHYREISKFTHPRVGKICMELTTPQRHPDPAEMDMRSRYGFTIGFLASALEPELIQRISESSNQLLP